MNIVYNNDNNNIDVCAFIDKKVSIKHYKDKNKNKTCVYGIFDFITKKDMDALLKLIKVKLGCSGTINEEEKMLVFSGDHVSDIKEMLINRKIIRERDFKM